MTENKSCHVGIFPPEVVFQVARCISKSLRMFGLTLANPGYNSQISTLRGAEKSMSPVDLRTGGVFLKRSEEALENSSRGFFSAQYCVSVFAGNSV